MNVRVSVVIPAYNSAATIVRAVESVLCQCEPNLEIIVVDDGSTDGTAELLAVRYPEQVIVIRQENRGAAAARNRGIAAARGEYVAFLDADDEWMPEKLRLQIAQMEANLGAALCFADMSHWEHGREVNSSYLRERGMGACGGSIFNHLLQECFIFTPTVVVRRTVFEAVGSFDESLRICEDYDLWLRIAERFELIFVDAPLLKRHRTGANLTGNRLLFAQCLVVLFERLLERQKGSRVRERIITSRLADAHYNLAYEYREAGDLRRSLTHYLASWRCRSSLRALKGALSCLPPTLRGIASGERRGKGDVS